MIAGTAVSVRQLNLYVKSLLDGDRRLSGISVTGEISNFKIHYASGHWYFTLKDGEAAVHCVMFRSSAARVRFRPDDGMQVVVRGRVSIYERDGQYQMYAEDITAGGAGDIALAFEEIKRRLLAEGLFDETNKRPLIKFPRRIAVITSETGAAVQDILNILARRWPICEVLLCPVSVQGETAVPEMLDALERVYRLGSADAIIIGRGGGSAEDLWAFNSEALARKIYESPVPVLSAVGHETDFTICDFVADLRAPTPSAAAELAVPDMGEILARLEKYRAATHTALKHRYAFERARLDKAIAAAAFKRPFDLVLSRAQRLDYAGERLQTAAEHAHTGFQARFTENAVRLDSMSPLKLMARGYTVAEHNGETVRSVTALRQGDRIRLKLTDGSADCLVEEITNGSI